MEQIAWKPHCYIPDKELAGLPLSASELHNYARATTYFIFSLMLTPKIQPTWPFK